MVRQPKMARLADELEQLAVSVAREEQPQPATQDVARAHLALTWLWGLAAPLAYRPFDRLCLDVQALLEDADFDAFVAFLGEAGERRYGDGAPPDGDGEPTPFRRHLRLVGGGAGGEEAPAAS